MKPLEIDKFMLFLRDRGSEILAPTNEFEVLRFTTPNGIGLVFCSKKQAISSMNEAARLAVAAFRNGASWRAGEATRRRHMTKKRSALIARDGDCCIYCEHVFSNDEEIQIIEHVVPVTAGGPNHLSNLVLACEDCDAKVGTMSAAEKIRYAIATITAKRAQRATMQIEEIV